MVKIIQNYSLHQQIGEGEYGKVFRAIDSRDKKEVAVKVINVKKFKQYPKLQQCTLNQIEILSKIECPHIIKFIQILKTANNFYFFYQFCNGGTLQDIIKKHGHLSQSQAIQYFQQILQAFKVLSAKNIMHRDLKPTNILMHNGRIKLADFGFCKTLQNQRDLTQTMLGSPIYMAPEVLKGEIYTVKADIWSLGVVLYQMLYGFCPFQQRSIARLINLLQSADVSYNSEINKVSPQIQQLMRKILVKDHFKRISWQQVFQFNLRQEQTTKKRYSNLNQNNRPDVSKIGEARTPLSEKQVQDISLNGRSKSPSGVGVNMFKKKTAPKNEGGYVSDDSSIWIQSHQKLMYFVKVIYQMVSFNFCPQITVLLASKLYLVIQKEHYKLPMRKQFASQRTKIAETVKFFQQSCKDKSQKSGGPLLTQYIKLIQGRFESSFNAKEDSKDLLIHCLNLLDINQIGNLKQFRDYKKHQKQQLITQLSQKIIRNTI